MDDFVGVAAQYEFRGPNQHVATASYGNDQGLNVEFSMESEIDHVKSREEGRTVHHDVPYITIHFPGDRTKKVVRPAKLKREDHTDPNPTDIERFPHQWKAFKEQEEQAPDGLPVEEWAPISKSQAKDLKAIGIHTVEQLAAMPEAGLNWLGARELQQKAKLWLERAGDGKDAARYAHEKAQMQSQIDVLRAELQELRLERQAGQEASKPSDTKGKKT